MRFFRFQGVRKFARNADVEKTLKAPNTEASTDGDEDILRNTFDAANGAKKKVDYRKSAGNVVIAIRSPGTSADRRTRINETDPLRLTERRCCRTESRRPFCGSTDTARRTGEPDVPCTLDHAAFVVRAYFLHWDSIMGKKIKIAIVGTHSTGKTSLVDFFNSRYNEGSVYVLAEVARDMINRGHKLGKGGTQDVYFAYVDEQLKREFASEKIDCDVLISDRTLVDGIAYPIINERLGITAVSKDLLNLFESILYLQKSFYDAYVYVPICFGNVHDGVRDAGEDYQKEADLEIKRLLLQHIGSYYQLPCGTVEDRYRHLLAIIRKIQE